MSRKKLVVKRKEVDFTLLLVTLLLVFIGIIMVFSSSWPEAMQKFDNGYHFLSKQVIFATLGLILMIVFMNIDYKIWKKFSFLIYLVALATVALLFTPLGVNYKGATRWIDLGITTFMPADAVKIGSIIFFSNFLANKKEDTGTLRQGTIPALIIIGISCGSIYIQRDLGTTLTLAGAMVAMFFVSGMKISHLVSLITMAVTGAFVIFKKAAQNPESKNAYRLRRIISFKDPFADKQGDGWQAVQSLYALGSGGLFGLGLGKSRQKFFYIPEPYNDFIFSIIGEELGFVGAFIVILLYLLLVWRGVRIALAAKDSFGCYLATGITALVTVQSLIHIAVVTSSIPTTGITLPFISAGGTSLVLYMSAMGILLNISRYADMDRS